MKKIKVAPYPNYIVAPQVMEESVLPQTEKAPANDKGPNLKKAQFMIAVYDDDTAHAVKPGPAVVVGNNSYSSLFPNPIHLFFDAALSNYTRSEEIKSKSFPTCAAEANKKIGEIHWLDSAANCTHDCYNEYFKCRLASVLMLLTSVEAFINFSLPNDYPNRTVIEREANFKDKLKEHLPAAIKQTEFWNERRSVYDGILALYDLRNDIVHLKTNSEDGFIAYNEVVKRAANYDIPKAVKRVQEFMNDVTPGFIEERN